MNKTRWFLAMLAVTASICRWANCADPTSQVDGFSEPYRTVHVAAADAGIVSELLVQEGQTVNKGDRLAVLDVTVYNSLLDIAVAARDATGDIDAARIDRNLAAKRFERVQQLRSAGHSTEDELWRVRSDMELADARWRAAQERQILRRLECQKLAAQIEARTVRATISGVVLTTHKQAGEYVGPPDPVVATLVQLDVLSIVFLYPRERATALTPGTLVTVQFLEGNDTTPGMVEIVSPVTDAESGTLRVKVRVENTDRRHAAGQRCRLVDKPPPTVKTGQRPRTQFPAPKR